VFEIFCSKRNNTKAACKMLVKLPSVVNFINILRAHFCRYFVTKNLQSQTLLEKSCSICFCTKNVRVKCWWNCNQDLLPKISESPSMMSSIQWVKLLNYFNTHWWLFGHIIIRTKYALDEHIQKTYCRYYSAWLLGGCQADIEPDTRETFKP